MSSFLFLIQQAISNKFLDHNMTKLNFFHAFFFHLYFLLSPRGIICLSNLLEAAVQRVVYLYFFRLDPQPLPSYLSLLFFFPAALLLPRLSTFMSLIAKSDHNLDRTIRCEPVYTVGGVTLTRMCLD